MMVKNIYQKKVAVIAVFLCLLLAASTGLFAVLQSKSSIVDVPQSTQQNQVVKFEQEKAQAYQGIKNQTENSLQEYTLQNQSRNLQSDLGKFDDKFFDSYFALLDDNVDVEILLEFLFSHFDEQEFAIMESMLVQSLYSRDELNINDSLIQRGSTRLVVTFYFTMAELTGWFTGSIWKLATACMGIGASAGIIGIILGAAIGVAIGGCVEYEIGKFLESHGYYFELTWFNVTVFSIWTFWNATITLDIAQILMSIF
ncbi:MAG: hypothetical protein LBU60_02070 [Clostridiales bacterium]|nr:hypothetical protein [Clostridiales bacterium]